MASTFQNFVQPAQEYFGYQKQPYAHTQYQHVNSAQSTPYTNYSPSLLSSPQTTGTTPYSPYTTTEYTPAIPPGEKPPEINRKTWEHYNRLQNITNYAFTLADVCSCLLTVFIESIMIFVLVKFYKTKNDPSPDRTSPWAKNSKLWPTYMLAGAALATFLLSVLGLILQCRKKRKSTSLRLTLKVIRVTIHIAAWLAVAAFYRIAKTEQDLWGWSCSEKAEAIQQYYKTSLDFERLCAIQGSSWIVSMVEVGAKIIFAIVGFYFQFRMNGIKRSIIRSMGEAGWETFQNFS